MFFRPGALVELPESPGGERKSRIAEETLRWTLLAVLSCRVDRPVPDRNSFYLCTMASPDLTRYRSLVTELQSTKSRNLARFPVTCLAVLLALHASCSRATPTVFLDIPLTSALERAEQEGKVVFLDFGATWCGPCKQLAETTLVDPRVEAWLREKTIPLQSDIDEAPGLAAEFKVRSVPTMVFLRPDRTVLGSIVGYRTADQFLAEGDRRLQGISAVDETAKVVKERPADLMARMQHFEELSRAGNYQPALEAAENYWQQSRDDMSQAGVRASFFLASMARLAHNYPPAAKMMDRWLSDASAAVGDSDADAMQAVTELVGLSRVLQRPQVVIQLAERTKGMGLRMIAMMGGDLLLQAGKYQLIVDSGICSPKSVTERIGMEKFIQGASRSGRAGDAEVVRDGIAAVVLLPFEALVGVGREAEAMEIAKLIQGNSVDAAIRARLAEVAVRLGRPDLAKQLRAGD